MKVGMRTPSPKRTIKAKTTGRIKREINSSINPVYGKKGAGYIKDPERAIKNNIYHKVTVDPLDSIKHPQSEGHIIEQGVSSLEYEEETPERRHVIGKFVLFVALAWACLGYVFYLDKAGLPLGISGLFALLGAIVFLIIAFISFFKGR